MASRSLFCAQRTKVYSYSNHYKYKNFDQAVVVRLGGSSIKPIGLEGVSMMALLWVGSLFYFSPAYHVIEHVMWNERFVCI